MIFNVLADAAGNNGAQAGGGAGTIIMLVLMVVAIIALFWFNRRNQKKRQDETEKLLNAIQPGNKVKTIGGICGIVVEVCPDDNTFVLETGTEKSGKSYIKFDRQAVYQTDAVVEPVKAAPVAEEKAEEKTEEAPVEATEENKEV